MSNKLKGNVLLLLAAMVWGTTFVGQKMGLQGVSAFTINAFRQSVAAILLLPIAIVKLNKTKYLSTERNSSVQIRNKAKTLLLGGFLCGTSILAAIVFQSVGLKSIDAGKAGFITSLYIVLVPIFSIVVGKKLSIKSIACCMLAMVGFGLLCLDNGLGSIKVGDLMVLVAACFFAIQILVINHFINAHNGLYLSVLQMAFGGIIGWILVILTHSFSLAEFKACLPVLLYLGIVPTCLGYTFQIVGIKYTDATTAALLMGMESVFSAIFGAMILGEAMALKELLGCVIIFVACTLIQIEKRPKIVKRIEQ